MAAQYDAFGTYLGDYESEEERKRREELANTAVHTQEIKTYGDGTQEKITKEEIPGAIAPKTMATAAGPVAPDEVYQRQLQAESGARQTTPGGQIVTSPKGALGIAQIMPSTAMSPGYGVPDIFALAQQRGIEVPDRSEATARQLLANKELNQAFGQNYSTAMRQRFGDQAGVAGYNMGPGAVERNMARNQGQFNVAQAPQETQGYLGKVLGGIGNAVNAVIPSAIAAPAPQTVRAQAYPEPGVAVATGRGVQGTTETPTPVAPTPFTQPNVQIDDQGNKLITNADGTTTVLGPDNKPLAAGGMEPRDTPEFRNRLFEEAGKDPMKWMEIAKNPEYTQFPGMQTVAKQQARTLLEQEFKADAATKEVEKTIAAATAGDPKASRAIADELKKQEGSWAKMILLGFLSPQLAGEEAVKLGFGNKWVSATDDKGNAALIQVNAKGLPLQGITADNKPVPEEQLAGYLTGGGLGKGTSLSAEVYIDPTTGQRYRSGYDNAGKAALVNIQGGPAYRGDPGKLVLQSIGTAAAKAEAVNAVELRYAGPKAYSKAGADYAGEFNAKHGTNIGYATQTPGAPLVDLNTGKPVTVTANGNISVTTGAPATTGGAPTTTAAAPGGAPAAQVPLDKLPKAPTMNAGESPEAFAERTKAWAKTYGKQYEQLEKNTKAAKDLLPYVAQMKDLINKGTSSGFGAIVDSVGNFVGYSTEGATAIAAIAPLANKVLMGVERFEGPQSDKDVASYKEASGKLADPNVPAAQKQAAFNTIVEIMKRNAPDLNWDSVSGTSGTSDVRKRADKIIGK